MASLTEVSLKLKKYTIFVVIAIFIFVIFKIVLAILSLLGVLIGSAIPLQAQNSFGQIPNISINALPYNHSAQLQFVLNTPSGGFPSEPSVADVYKYKSVDISLLSLDQASKIALSMGFHGPSTKVSDNIYTWQTGYENLIYNLQTNQFRIQNSNPFGQINLENSSQLNNGQGPLSISQSGAISAVTNMLSSLPVTVSTDYDTTNPSVIFLNYASNGSISVEQDIASANAIRVVFHRYYKYLLLGGGRSASKNTLPLLTDNPIDGNISFTVDSDSATLTNNLVDMSFSDTPIDATTYSTYTIKNPQQAWEDVQSGQAYLVYLVKAGQSPFSAYQTLNVSEFQATSISLAYFDGLRQSDYLQPIYVIKGTAILADGSSADFYFYDPAVI